MRGGALPSGVVTFVFTDVEGSTGLLRHLGEEYEPVLQRSFALLDHAWEAHGGSVIDATGDSAFVAFGDAGAAVAACVDGQRRLAAESWPDGGRPRVRMGVHTGLASPRGDHYVALAVHQAVRVMTAAHGGQIVLSEQCADEIGRPDGYHLVPLGRFRLRDFDGPVRVHMVAAPGLAPDFPALRAVPADGHNLVRPPTPCLGRADELREIAVQTRPGRVLTLLGPGGVGKTRLATEAGIAAAEHWDDGVWMVELAPLQDPALIGNALATAVGAPGSAGSDRWKDAVDHLAALRALLVLDNGEHLVDALAPLVAQLLARCPGVGVLATSRERLAIPAERVLPVAPLQLPSAGAGTDEARAMPAVELFLQRADAVCPGFALDESNVEAVIGICRRVDGLPLALELAAAQLTVLDPARLLKGLQDCFALLRSRERGRPDRQATMEAAIDWSARLLAAQERVALRRLAVFAKDFSLDAAVAALADEDTLAGSDVPELVWRLVERSLVSIDLSGRDSRYRLLETVRAYAWQRLEQAEEQAVVAQRLARWWVERLGPWQPLDRLRSGQIADEMENLRALVPMLAVAQPELAQQLACTIGRFYYAVLTPRHSIDELTGYAEQLTTPSPARVFLLTTLANLHVRNGDTESAGRVAAAAAEQCADVGAPPWDDVAVERALGEVALRSRDHETASRIARGALERDLSDRGRARMLNLLGLSSHFAGDDVTAADALQQELDVARTLEDDHLVTIASGNLAELALAYGDASTAARHQRVCLELGLALGSAVQLAMSTIVAARLVVNDDPALAVRLQSKAEQVLADNAHRLYDEDLDASQRMLEQARQVLGAAYDSARETGRAMPLTEAARAAGQALETVGAAGAERSQAQHTGGRT